jgi:hypothetical protein
MSEIIGQQLLKLEARHDSKTTALVQMESGGTGSFFRDSGLRVEINVTRGGALVDVSNFLTATLQVKKTSTRSAAVYLTSTISPNAGIDPTVTQAEHAAKTPGRAHLTFDFSAGDTAESILGGSPADSVEHWAVLTATFTGVASAQVIATGLITSVNAGVTAAVATPGVVTPVSLETVMALLNNFVTYDVPAGKMIRFRGTQYGKQVTRTIGLVIDPDQGPVPVDSIELEQPQP